MDEEIKKRFDVLEEKIDRIGKILAGGLKVQLQVPRPQIVPQSKIVVPKITGVKSGPQRRLQKQIE